MYVTVKPNDTEMADLEAKHEDVLVLKGHPEMAPWLIVVRRPTRQESIGYKSHAKKDSTTAGEALVRRITVFPAQAELDRILDRWPLAPDFILDDQTFKDFVGLAASSSLKF